jgi:hypothetical protein
MYHLRGVGPASQYRGKSGRGREGSGHDRTGGDAARRRQRRRRAISSREPSVADRLAIRVEEHCCGGGVSSGSRRSDARRRGGAVAVAGGEATRVARTGTARQGEGRGDRQASQARLSSTRKENGE